MKNVIYLDHAATTFPEEAVVAAMAECMRKTPFNASAAYGAAGQARRIARLCRTQLSGMLSCSPQEIVFTSGGTEGNNQVLRSFCGAHVVLSAIEHASVLEAAKAARCAVTLVRPDETGVIAPESIAAALRADTKLICLMATNNETGVVQPIEEVSRIARNRRIHLHVDAVQAFGHIPVSAACCDSMTISAHKLYGPRGVGALFIGIGAAVSPLLCGGGQERGLRAGTENTPAICGFHVAAQMADEDMQLRMNRERSLMDGFLARLCALAPEIRLLGEGRNRLPGGAAIQLPGLSAEEAIAAMDLKGILISGGAACAARSGAPSHVYTAMGLSGAQAAQVIRVSIGRHTTKAELDETADALADFIRQRANQNTSR